MATREEEYNNLCTMYNSLVDIENLKKERENLNNQIRAYESRAIEEYPEYEAVDYEKQVQDKLEDRNIQAGWIANIITLIIPTIYGIYFGIQLWKMGGQSLFDMLIFAVIFFGALAFAFIPFVGHIVAAGAHLFWVAFFSFGGEEFLKNNFLTSAAILGIMYVIWLVLVGISAAVNGKKKDKMLDEAEKKEAERHMKYLNEKAIADVEINRKKRELEIDTANKTAPIKQKIYDIDAIINSKVELVLRTPGLANEDKNLYTLQTLITYFNRGKVDSIKEAINLYDAEEYRKQVDMENQIQLELALENMQEEQRKHNEEIEFQQRMHNERSENEQRNQNDEIQNRLDKISNKVDDLLYEKWRNS